MTYKGVGLLESSWHRIWIGIGLKICKTGLDKGSKKIRVRTPLYCSA